MQVVLTRRVYLVTAALMLWGCGDPTGPESVPGRYDLVLADGMPLPMVLSEVPGFKLEITGGHLQISADGTCSLSLASRITEGGGVTTDTQADPCTWTQNNTAISLTFPGTDTTDTGSLIGGRISIVSKRVDFLFEK